MLMLKSFLVRHDVLLIRVSPEIYDYSIESDLIKKQNCITYLHFIGLLMKLLNIQLCLTQILAKNVVSLRKIFHLLEFFLRK